MVLLEKWHCREQGYGVQSLWIICLLCVSVPHPCPPTVNCIPINPHFLATVSRAADHYSSILKNSSQKPQLRSFPLLYSKYIIRQIFFSSYFRREKKESRSCESAVKQTFLICCRKGCSTRHVNSYSLVTSLQLFGLLLVMSPPPIHTLFVFL